MIRRLLLATAGVLAVAFVAAAGLMTWLLAGDGVRVALESQLSGWLGQPVKIGDVSTTFVPRLAITLEQVAIGEPARVTLGRVDLSTGLRPLLSRRLEDAEVVVSDSRIEMPLPFALPVPSTQPAASADSSEAGGIEIVSVRRISLRDLVIVSLGRELRLSADSALNGSRLAITSFTAASGDLTIETHGSVDFEPKVTASLQATSELLDFDSLLALATAFMGDAPESGGSSAPAVDARISLRVTAPRARAAGLDLTEFDGVMTLYEGELSIDPLTFKLFGGQHEGWLSANLGEILDVRVGSSVANIDVAQLAKFGGAEGAITGRMAATGRFGARGRDIGAVLASARGVGDVTIADGTIRSLNLVRTVLSFLSRSSEASGNGDAFEQISGSFALADQRVTTEDLTLETQDIDVLARGSLNLDTKALDGRANLVLSESFSAKADQRLYRFAKMGDRVVLPATIGGKLGEPRIGIDAGAAVRRGLQNEIERRLENFFQRVGPL